MHLVNSALIFAAKKHDGQFRKKEGVPYITHPVEVMSIVSRLTSDENALAAAVLHDTVEDTDTTLEEIEELFGKEVRELVAHETEDKRRDKPAKDTWKIRKVESLAALKAAENPFVSYIWLGDKLSNMRSLNEIFDKKGDACFDSFNMKDKSQQAWYYHSICDILENTLSDKPEFVEFKQLVTKIFGEKAV